MNEPSPRTRGRPTHARLIARAVVPCAAVDCSQRERRIHTTRVGPALVITRFTGVNSGIGLDRDLWFETMVFGGVFDGQAWRYTTWDEAALGHTDVVARVRATLTGRKLYGVL